MNVCRFCVREKFPLKDLLETNNTSICKIVEKFTHKSVSARDELPTKICLNCEEKFVTFELFLLECQRAQEYFVKALFLHSEVTLPIKVEDEDHGYLDAHEPEVKSEISDDHKVDIQNNYDQNNDNGGDDDFQNSSDYDELDDINIASLKKIIHNDPEKKDINNGPEDKDINSEYDDNKNALNELLQKPKLQISDLVKFNCSHCGKQFVTWSRLRNHSIKEHSIRPTVDCVCGFTIRTRSVFYSHIAIHKMKHREMKKHDASISEERKRRHGWRLPKYIDFTCKRCNNDFNGWYQLKKHYERKHKGERPVVHCTCGVALKSKTMTYRHIEDHEDYSAFRCDICQKVSRTLEALEKHKQRHVPKSERHYRCPVCGKICKSKDLLKSHEKSHIPIEKRKVFVCEICSMKFTTKSAARLHRLTVHEKVKGYVCDMCGFSCATGGELKQHRAIHSEDKPFQCSKCEKSFKTYSNLKTHCDTHEGTSYACYLCNRVLNSKRTLRKHLLVHEDNCKHVCPYCGKAFKRRQTLVVHQHIHTGDKPVTCKICGDKFTYASSLRTHKIRCHPDICPPRDRPSAQAQILGLND